MSHFQHVTNDSHQRHGPELVSLLRATMKRWVDIDTRLSFEAVYEDVLNRLPIWNNRALHCADPSLNPFTVGYVGRLTQLHVVTSLFRLNEELFTRTFTWSAAIEPHTSLVCDYPIPGALVVPRHLRMFVPLNRSWNDITAHLKLTARHRACAESCTVQRVEDEATILRINREMFEPFAKARHGKEANNLAEQDVVRLARSGHLGLLSRNSESIAAHLGYSYDRKAQRYWECLRFGYPEHVFSAQRCFADINTVNAYWAIRYAVDTGHDVFDFGISPSPPDGGLLQFKHRRNGGLSAFSCGIPFWLRLPRADVDEFLWRWPIFSLEKDGIVLNVGVPERFSSEDIATRLRPLAYRGLSVVRVRRKHNSAPLLDALKRIFESSSDRSRHKAPTLELVNVS